MDCMLMISCLILVLQNFVTCGSGVQAQHQGYTTPVPILKQIDRQNSDGSYTYGYEAADKSFKIETKYPNGEVYGKYGYVDDQGNVREIEYGASRRGFEPAGSDINVPPPTLKSNNPYPLNSNEEDDGQYREDPSVYFKNQKYNRPIPASKFSLNNYPQYQQAQPQPQQQQQQQQHHHQYQQNYNSAPAYRPAPQYYNPTPTQRPYYQPPFQTQPQLQSSYFNQYHQPAAPLQPQYNPYDPYSQPQHFHPAVKSLDLWTGSYTLDYTGRK